MRVFALLFAIAFLGTAVDYAQFSDSHAESKLIALELVAKVQAPRTNDVRVLGDILDDSYMCVDADGRLLNKAAVLANLKATSPIELVADSMAVRSKGDTAIVTGLYWLRGVERGKSFVRRCRFVDTWLYREGRWVAISSLSTPSAN